MPRRLEITPSDREIQITRAFDAPRALVWDCHTLPELARTRRRSARLGDALM